MIKPAKLILTGLIVALLWSIPSSNASFSSFSEEEQPAVVVAVAPNYPRVAKAVNYGKSGEVVVEVEIDTKGNVISASFISGGKLFQGVSERAAKRWQFAPVNGNSKIRKARLIFIFSNVFTRADNDADQEEDSVRTVFMPPYRVEIRYKNQPIY
jgi:TonB family protein